MTWTERLLKSQIMDMAYGLPYATYLGQELQDPAFDYVYDQIEGLGHEWKFWDEELRRFLEYLGI